MNLYIYILTGQSAPADMHRGGCDKQRHNGTLGLLIAQLLDARQRLVVVDDFAKHSEIAVCRRGLETEN